METYLILPVRGRARTEIVGRRTKSLCSQCSPVMDCIEGASQRYHGRCHDSALRCANLQFLGKHWVMEIMASPIGCAVTGRRTVEVVGGVACGKWPAMLTGESPRRPKKGKCGL